MLDDYIPGLVFALVNGYYVIPLTVKSCLELHAPSNGTVKCSQERPTIDTECTFACDPGFQLVGSRVRTCLPVAMWDGIPAYCKREPRFVFGLTLLIICMKS